jgi:hypothetical protein
LEPPARSSSCIGLRFVNTDRPAQMVGVGEPDRRRSVPARSGRSAVAVSTARGRPNKPNPRPRKFITLGSTTVRRHVRAAQTSR